MATIYLFDNGLEGFFTCVFEAYSLKVFPDVVKPRGAPVQLGLLDHLTEISSDPEKAGRVWNGLEKRLSAKALGMVNRLLLSEWPDIETLVFQYVRLVFDNKESIETDYRNPIVLSMREIHRKMAKETVRMISFVRFQRSADGIYFAAISPDFNVLPYIGGHFRQRFPDMPWVIYDLGRDYGIYFDLNEIAHVQITNLPVNPNNGQLEAGVVHEEELMYRSLWKEFYRATNTPERKNLKQHLSYLPRRYWKYLIEKDIHTDYTSTTNDFSG